MIIVAKCQKWRQSGPSFFLIPFGASAACYQLSYNAPSTQAYRSEMITYIMRRGVISWGFSFHKVLLLRWQAMASKYASSILVRPQVRSKWMIYSLSFIPTNCTISSHLRHVSQHDNTLYISNISKLYLQIIWNDYVILIISEWLYHAAPWESVYMCSRSFFFAKVALTSSHLAWFTDLPV